MAQSLKYQPQMMMGQYWLVPNKLSDQSKMLLKVATEFKKLYLTEFSTD